MLRELQKLNISKSLRGDTPPKTEQAVRIDGIDFRGALKLVFTQIHSRFL